MTNEGSGRTCLFCGATSLNGEHLLPEWMQKVLPSTEAVVHYRQIGNDASDRHEWIQKPFREKTHFVCPDCNSGWMSELEKASRPILAPAMMQAGPYTLDQAAQAIAATWAFKTALVFQGSQAEPVAPASQYEFLRANRLPPPEANIWLGSHYQARHNPGSAIYLQKPLSLAPFDNQFKPTADFGYVSFLAIGGISFLVVGHRYRNKVEITCREPFSDALIKIWPRRDIPVNFPPSLMMDRDFIDLIFSNVEPPLMEVRVFPP